MSEIKTITATSTEQEITLDATYQFMWFRNLGDNDCYVSDHSGIIAGADDVALVKGGDSTRITVPYNKTVYVKAVSDSVDMEIHAQNFSDAPFEGGSGGGGGKNVGHKTITENGYYYASDDGYDGYDIVTVQCPKDPINTTTATFTQNGTYTPPSGYDGYSSFTVAVSGVQPQVKLKAGTTYEQAQALACPAVDEIVEIDGIYYIRKISN